MNIYDWYQIFNLTDFMVTELVSRKLSLSLQGIGDVEMLITRGNQVSIQYADRLLPVPLIAEERYEQDGYAIVWGEDDFVYLGILVAA